MKVIVIGNCSIDLSFSVPRLPRPGETLLARQRSLDLGGKGANQAVVAARFGAETILAAPIGRDADGDKACARLAAEGLCLAVKRTDAPTDQSIILVAPDGQNCIVSSQEAACRADPEWAEGVLREAARRGDLLLMQGNLPLRTTLVALSLARRLGMLTLLNPAPIQYEYDQLLPLADIVIVNEIEARELGGHADPFDAGRAIHERAASRVIVTLGARGAALIEDELMRAPAPVVDAIDTVGAGDTLVGAFAAALAGGRDSSASLRIAVDAASLAVTRGGTQSSFPTASEAANILARHSADRRKG
ncbi:MAG: ribokinase [Methylobacteriaceae bacterium]|nr:ribokinase [Methylobacteriaceae bacterium]